MKHIKLFEQENPNDKALLRGLVKKYIESVLDFGADGMEVLLDGIAKEYEDNADELTNMDAKAIGKHIREALALLKKRTSN